MDTTKQEGEKPKQNRGFRAMSAERQKEIASKGGKAAHEQGTAHQWTKEEATEAGRKGGQNSRGGRSKTQKAVDEHIFATEIMNKNELGVEELEGFEALLNEKAKLIYNKRENNTVVVIQEGDMNRALKLAYMGHHIKEAEIQSTHIQRLANMVNQAADQGWIEHGCIAPAIKMVLRKLVSTKAIPETVGEAMALSMEDRGTHEQVSNGWIIMFYAFSRHSIEELKAFNHNFTAEGEIPKA